jgi:hypothetical protein
MGLIPVELDIEGLYETQDRRRKKSTSDKVVPPHVHSVCKKTLALFPHKHNDEKQWLMRPPASTGSEPSFAEGIPRQERETDEGDRGEARGTAGSA